MLDPLLELTDAGELAADIRRLFAELEQSPGSKDRLGECSPPIDVAETEQAYTIHIDVPGVSRRDLRVFFKRGAVIVVGHKPSLDVPPEGIFHRIERDCGRFARTVRLGGAVDGAKVHARLRLGELIVVVPKIADRRAQAFPVPVE